MALTAQDYITINGNQILRPPAFAPQIEDIYAGEYTTCTGKTVGDVVGWKYSDATLTWDALPQSSVDVLVAMSGENTLSFVNPSGMITTETVIRDSVVQLQNRNTIRGEVWWKNVSVAIRFINAHS
ncbi:MAG: hypothetical protein UHU21_07525 [Lachnospiraceae bacterium]|nr:hypothetical protein [Lachnospiraceae bacterium]